MNAWYDRVNGQLLRQLPEIITEGQFAANVECKFNSHAMIRGQLLVNDGTGKFYLNDEVREFAVHEEPAVDATELNIIENALLAYKDVIEHGGIGSFLIPEKLLARFALSNFEQLLSEVISKGHLEEIARRPRMELIYEEYLVPVSRAKKLAPNATRHLASHSECWQTRTFTGVVPKSILALESEDQLNIYENRVYVKLLSNVEKYLIERIAEVRKLEELFESAMSFQNAENIYHEVSESVFTLWGEGFSHESDADEATSLGRTTLSILIGMLKKVRTLQHTKLYRKLNQNLYVPLKINMTNVLSHDQHYRHVARLWHMWLETQQTSKLDPQHIYERNQELVNAYIQYCFDLTTRALNELKFVSATANYMEHVNRDRLRLEKTSFGEILIRHGEKELALVPWFTTGSLHNETDAGKNSERIILRVDALFDQSESIVCLSPTYFYSLESLTTKISQWLALHEFSKFGKQLNSIPGKLIEELGKINNGYWKIKGYQLTINKPCGSIISELKEIAKRHKTDISVQRATQELISSVSDVEHLLSCPVCSSKASERSWQERDDQCFIVHNSNCKHEWMLNRQQNGDRHLVARPLRCIESSELNFNTYGRYGWEMKIN